MNIEEFMQGYKAAWERKNKYMFAALFVADGEYPTFHITRAAQQA